MLVKSREENVTVQSLYKNQAAEEFGDAVQALVYDVSIPQLVAHMAAQIEADFGACHALINNAGVADFGPITETSFERWRRVMDTNLDGVFLVSQAMFELMRKTAAESYASIVNIA